MLIHETIHNTENTNKQITKQPYNCKNTHTLQIPNTHTHIKKLVKTNTVQGTY
jgi:hypothetical protein